MKNFLVRRELIRDFMVENHLDTEQFCKMCKIPPLVLSQLLLNDFNFDVHHFARMCKTMNKNMHELLIGDNAINNAVVQQIKKQFA